MAELRSSSTIDTARLDQVIGILTFLILIGKAIPWITLALATWTLYNAISDVKNHNWIWAAINLAFALGGYVFVAGLARKRRQAPKARLQSERVTRGEAQAA